MITSVKSPDSFYLPEKILSLTRMYYFGRWGETVTTAAKLDELRERQFSTSADLQDVAHAAEDAVEKGRVGEALVHLKKAPDILLDSLQDKPLSFLTQLFQFISLLTRDGHEQRPETVQLSKLVQPLLRYAAGFTMEASLLSDRHPIRQLFYYLSRCTTLELRWVARQAMRVGCEAWEEIVQGGRANSHFIM